MLVVTDRSWSPKGGFTCRQAPNQKLSYVRVGQPENGASSGPVERLQAVSFRRLLIDTLRDLGAEHGRPVVVIPIHGYNQEWSQALDFFSRVDSRITSSIPGGLTVGFSWASAGAVANYVGDRVRARASAVAFSSALSQALRMLQDERCPAEIAAVAHSMGNYMLCKAAEYAAELHGDPHFQVFSEVLMVAADVDGGAFEDGVAKALVRFSRRVTGYRSVHDEALRASRVKRAGATGRRLGRQGVDHLDRLPSNVVMVDASERAEGVSGIMAHSHHFYDEATIADMVAVLNGLDRTAITGRQERPDGEYFLPRATP